jgi:hypothetical protein
MQLLVSRKSPAAPVALVMEMPDIVSTEFPVFVSVRFAGALVVPTS